MNKITLTRILSVALATTLQTPADAKVIKAPKAKGNVNVSPVVIGGGGSALIEAPSLFHGQNTLTLPNPTLPVEENTPSSEVEFQPQSEATPAEELRRVIQKTKPREAAPVIATEDAPEKSLPGSEAPSTNIEASLPEGKGFGLAERKAPQDSEELDTLFDGSRQHSGLSSLVNSRYEPSVYDTSRIADRRYADLIDKQWSFFSGLTKSNPENREIRGLQSRNALLERMRRRDPATFAHMMRVGLLSGLIAKRMGYGQTFSNRLAWAAAFHDVGKSDPEILKIVNKPGKLTEEEREIINRHPAEGAARISKLKSLPEPIKTIALRVAIAHHEKQDGTGYPNKLKGKDIPLEARIIAVADVFDALMETRPYREGMSWEKALSIMEKMGPGHFDSKALDAFLSISRGRGPPTAKLEPATASP